RRSGRGGSRPAWPAAYSPGVVIDQARAGGRRDVTVITVTSVAIVGLGLIGGSLLRRLGPHLDVRGYDSDQATRAAAAEAGFRTAATLEDAVSGSDLVVLATPLPAFGELIPQVAKNAGPGPLVTDVASVKVTPRELMRTHAPG